jgi:4-amino-4-deoxy-L-arabinose transferase-like glycosyltransferase
MTPTTEPRWDRASIAIVLGLCAAKVLLHLALINRYGYHGDELYFIDCGRHLALGYVDHPPLIPWIARLADELGGGLFVLRLPAIAAGAGTMAVTALIVREWGGGYRAQLLTLLCLLVAPAHLRIGAMLNIPVIEVFLCTLTAYFVIRALARGERWMWLLAGAVLGLAVLAKHASLIWAAALGAGVIATSQRRALLSPWPWLGGVLALAIIAPNIVWQAQHDFATLEFMRTLRADLLVSQGRALFVAGQLLYFHPLAVPVWIAGLAFAFTEPGRVMRPFAVLFLFMFAFFFIAGGKPYYIASAYPAVLAAGGVALERFFAARAVVHRTFVGSLTATGIALGVLTLPLLPIQTVDDALEALLGFAVPPIALTHDMHGMHGWQEHVAAIDRVQRSLPAHERDQASVLAGTYSQAAALNVLGTPGTPHAVSGSVTYYLWGPDAERGDVLITYGLPLELIAPHYETCIETTRIDAPLARPQDRDLPVYVCREPRGTMAELWPELRRFGPRTRS